MNIKERLKQLRAQAHAKTEAKLAALRERMKAAPKSGDNAMLSRTEDIRKKNLVTLNAQLAKVETPAQRKARRIEQGKRALLSVTPRQREGLMARYIQREMDRATK